MHHHHPKASRERMKRFAVGVAYKGTHYVGWSKQAYSHVYTVQQSVEGSCIPLNCFFPLFFK
jgi:hypothetical protein